MQDGVCYRTVFRCKKRGAAPDRPAPCVFFDVVGSNIGKIERHRSALGQAERHITIQSHIDCPLPDFGRGSKHDEFIVWLAGRHLRMEADASHISESNTRAHGGCLGIVRR